jgi:simple sugar transport system substrate-binding protein
MNNKIMWRFTALLMVLVLVLSACAPAATPTQAPTKPAAVEPTKPPAAPTKPPAEPTKPPVEPTKAPAPTQAPTQPPAAAKEFPFGLLMVGPYNDRGWSQAHYEGGQYVEKNVPGAKMIYIDKVNSADRPGTTPQQLAEDLVSKGAKVIIFNSDDLKDGAIEFAKAHPDIPVIHASGDMAWKDGKNFLNLPNVSNVMPQMEYTKMIAGCAAALSTETGKIGYIGPLINDETRRFVNSAYLGAKYCWEKIRGKNPADLKFKVTWIGFWFNIPGVTSDPTQVANDFINSGYDVLMSGLDTTEAVTEAGKAQAAGKKVWSVGYDYPGACDEAPNSCLGAPWFNWGPSYVQMIKSAMAGQFKPEWLWTLPDWKDINNVDTTGAGFIKGKGLSADNAAKLDGFVKELADGLKLWKGPLSLQDGTVYLKDGEAATDQQIWYMPQLLKGVEGQSVPSS